MTREQIMERQPVFEGLVKLYEQAFKGNEVRIIVDWYVVRTEDSLIDFGRDVNALVEFLTSELRRWLAGEV